MLETGCYHSASKTHVRYRIFKLTPIHASVINQIPWICWIHWISVPFRENSNQKQSQRKKTIGGALLPRWSLFKRLSTYHCHSRALKFQLKYSNHLKTIHIQFYFCLIKICHDMSEFKYVTKNHSKDLFYWLIVARFLISDHSVCLPVLSVSSTSPRYSVQRRRVPQ